MGLLSTYQQSIPHCTCCLKPHTTGPALSMADKTCSTLSMLTTATLFQIIPKGEETVVGKLSCLTNNSGVRAVTQDTRHLASVLSFIAAASHKSSKAPDLSNLATRCSWFTCPLQSVTISKNTGRMTEQSKSPKLLEEKFSPEKKGQRDIIYMFIYDTIFINDIYIYT